MPLVRYRYPIYQTHLAQTCIICSECKNRLECKDLPRKEKDLCATQIDLKGSVAWAEWRLVHYWGIISMIMLPSTLADWQMQSISLKNRLKKKCEIAWRLLAKETCIPGKGFKIRIFRVIQKSHEGWCVDHDWYNVFHHMFY